MQSGTVWRINSILFWKFRTANWNSAGFVLIYAVTAGHRQQCCGELNPLNLFHFFITQQVCLIFLIYSHNQSVLKCQFQNILLVYLFIAGTKKQEDCQSNIKKKKIKENAIKQLLYLSSIMHLFPLQLYFQISRTLKYNSKDMKNRISLCNIKICRASSGHRQWVDTYWTRHLATWPIGLYKEHLKSFL